MERGTPLPNDKHAGKKNEEKSPLSELIEKLNERFGTEFGDMDKVLEQFVADMEKTRIYVHKLRKIPRSILISRSMMHL